MRSASAELACEGVEQREGKVPDFVKRGRRWRTAREPTGEPR
jgi:hypothetical protein